MLKKHAQLFEGFLTASDLLVASIAWVASYFIRFNFFPVDKGVPPFGDYLRILIFVWLIWAFVYRRFGLYRPMRVAGRLKEAWTVIKANSLSVVLLLVMTYLFREKSVPFSRLVFLIFWSLSTVLSVGARAGIRAVLRAMRRRGYNLRHTLIVGSGDLAAKVGEKMFEHPEFGISLVGCLTADPPQADFLRMQRPIRAAAGLKVGAVIPMGEFREPTPASDDLPEGLKVIGTYSDIPLLLERGGIDEIVVALPLEDHDKMAYVLSLIGDRMVHVRIVPDLHPFIQLGSLVESIDGLPVVSLASTPLVGFNLVLKRVFDLFFGSIFLLLSLPVMCVTALLVKLTSPGPIFFSQERLGLDGRPFQIFKFRTMRIDAEKEGARFAIKNDPRVTPVGKCLRRWNIDELPQLLNVLLGQMSLVGPRPERPVFIEEFRRHFPKYMLRHKVQAGMTGWAQVHGWRGNTSIAHRIEHDFYYIENWSILLDIKIILLTFLYGFRDRNAY